MVAILLAALTFLGASQVGTGRDNTLYYDDKGANFVPWIQSMLEEVQRTWIASMPYAANIYAGHTAIGFTVAQDGNVTALETIVQSGVPGFDSYAAGAIRAARLLPLPSDYPDETFDIIFVFWVNERPYDIFDGKSDVVLDRLRQASTSEKSEPTSPASGDLKVDADLGGRDSTVKKNTIIYDEPIGTSQRLARLDDGETVHIVAKAEGDFWEVQYGDVHGFVHDLLLQKGKTEISDPAAIEGNGFGGGAYRMDSGITPPTVIKQVRPTYTDEALTKKVQGEVILEVVILAEGKIRPVRILRGLSAGLNEKAIECVRQWEFVPGKLKGQPVDVLAEIVVEFSILEKPK